MFLDRTGVSRLVAPVQAPLGVQMVQGLTLATTEDTDTAFQAWSSLRASFGDNHSAFRGYVFPNQGSIQNVRDVVGAYALKPLQTAFDRSLERLVVKQAQVRTPSDFMLLAGAELLVSPPAILTGENGNLPFEGEVIPLIQLANAGLLSKERALAFTRALEPARASYEKALRRRIGLETHWKFRWGNAHPNRIAELHENDSDAINLLNVHRCLQAGILGVALSLFASYPLFFGNQSLQEKISILLIDACMGVGGGALLDVMNEMRAPVTVSERRRSEALKHVQRMGDTLKVFEQELSRNAAGEV